MKSFVFMDFHATFALLKKYQSHLESFNIIINSNANAVDSALSSNLMYARYAAHCTIKQHYYPENAWGWVIVVTGVMVQILATGIHGAAGAWLLLDGTKRYRQSLLNVGTLRSKCANIVNSTHSTSRAGFLRLIE